uniref:Uncharacterized protein n=1 Tax=Hippocampus comes TaxID=109280 RepID=A0A3Q2XR09_HIPCM
MQLCLPDCVRALTKGRVSREGLHHHGLLGDHLDDGSISGLDKLGVVLKLLAGTTVDLFNELLELAGDVSCVAVQHGGIALVDLARVVQDAHLSIEVIGTLGWVVLAIACNVTTTDLLYRHILDVEADIVAGDGFREGLVVHLHGFDLSGQVGGSKCDDHARFQNASLNTTHGHCSDTWTDSRFVAANSLELRTKWHHASCLRFCRHPAGAGGGPCLWDVKGGGWHPELPAEWCRWHCPPCAQPSSP